MTHDRDLTFSERLVASKCRFCGPGMGKMARSVPVLGSKARRAYVLVMCPHCGGYSAAFREDACQ